MLASKPELIGFQCLDAVYSTLIQRRWSHIEELELWSSRDHCYLHQIRCTWHKSVFRCVLCVRACKGVSLYFMSTWGVWWKRPRICSFSRCYASQTEQVPYFFFFISHLLSYVHLLLPPSFYFMILEPLRSKMACQMQGDKCLWPKFSENVNVRLTVLCYPDSSATFTPCVYNFQYWLKPKKTRQSALFFHYSDIKIVLFCDSCEISGLQLWVGKKSGYHWDHGRWAEQRLADCYIHNKVAFLSYVIKSWQYCTTGQVSN